MKLYNFYKIAAKSNKAFERTCLFVALSAKKHQKVRQKAKPLNLALE